jgi:hypothetical protein
VQVSGLKIDLRRILLAYEVITTAQATTAVTNAKIRIAGCFTCDHLEGFELMLSRSGRRSTVRVTTTMVNNLLSSLHPMFGPNINAAGREAGFFVLLFLLFHSHGCT